VVGKGWRNAIQNVFGILNTCKRNDIPTVSLTTDKNRNTSDIPIASKSRQNIHQNQAHITSTIYPYNVPVEELPSTSKICSGSKQAGEGVSASRTSSSEPDLKSYRRSIGDKIISHMLSNIENEDAYLHYFKQLAIFEEGLNHQDESNIFEIVYFHYSQNERKGRVKSSNKNLDREAVQLANSKNTRPQIVELKVNLTGKQVDRVAIRRDALDNFYDPNFNDDLYEEFLDRLIALEESLIEDNSYYLIIR